jgi:hypothetical protein
MSEAKQAIGEMNVVEAKDAALQAKLGQPR